MSSRTTRPRTRSHLGGDLRQTADVVGPSGRHDRCHSGHPRPERRRHDVMSCATETLQAPTLAQFLVSVAGSVTAALAAYSGEAIEVAKPAGAYATHFGIEATDELVVRSYLVVVGPQAVMAVTERFPADSLPTTGE